MNSGLAASFIKRFAGGPAIRVENLATAQGATITVLFGASGSGKSTVLRCLAGLERPDEGFIRLNAEAWFDASRRFFLPPRERHVGFVPQDYALFPHLTVERNIAFGLDQMGTRDRRQRVSELLAWLDLTPLEKRLPRELSGGQQQRVALARAVARRPRLLLLDEPLSALDTPTRLRLRGELRGLLRQLAVPTVLVTHDRQEALSLGDDLIIMDEGRMVQQGPVAEVFSRPKNLAAAGILAVETIVPGRVTHCAEGLATVLVQQIALTALAQDLPANTGEVYVCIRAEDVILTLDAEAHSSPRNRLSGVVQRLEPDGPLLRVSVDCGFSLLALLTKPACEELALQPGCRVHAWIKAPQIHLIPHAVR